MEDLIVGYSGLSFNTQSFDLSHGVELRSVYAHLMAPFMLAFSPAAPGSHHPGPWRAAQGGLGFDVLAELFIPASIEQTLGHDPSVVAWIVTALVRLRVGPRLRAPVLSTISFREASAARLGAHFRAVEVEPQVLKLDIADRAADIDSLTWVRDNWLESIALFKENAGYRLLFDAFDQVQFNRSPDLALLQLWSALEALFSPARPELRYRVSINIASYLAPPGSERMSLYRQVVKLYDARSSAAHGGDAETLQPLTETYSLISRILETMTVERHAPTRDELEARVFGLGSDPPVA